MYRLSVHQIEQSCLFDLSWGQGQRITATLPYPATLPRLYQGWRQAYLSYYQQALRGRAAVSGQLAASQAVDWHAQLVQAEAKLLSEFHKWLKHEALYDLRAELMRGQGRELFLTCTSVAVARLPWETWEVGAEFGQQDRIQIVRSPATIRSQSVNRQQFRRGRTRVLAILGDDTGLDFKGDRKALDALGSQLEIQYIGWQPGEDGAALKQRICQEIADPVGWDVLFFAGHSNEADYVDGQIFVAPQTSLTMRELAPTLQKAQHYGLQFALFNSCSGLDIANSLIDLGLSQVAIMREPIHNQVAHQFLVQFLQRLARLDDVQTALLQTCRFLRLEKNLTYPSAYLVPSLFRHPESTPYRVLPTGWQQQLRRWLPTPVEAIAIGTLAIASLLPALQDPLMNRRVWVQAMYRQMTGQVAPNVRPPIVLVQIDDATLQARRIAAPLPIDRSLLADLVTSLEQMGASVVGIDYLLDRPTPEDVQLQQSVSQAIADQPFWTIFASRRSQLGEWLTVHPDVASPNWSLEGDVWVPWWAINPARPRSDRPFPFTYQLALAYRLHQSLQGSEAVPQPSLQSQQRLQAQIEGYLEAHHQGRPPISAKAQLNPITRNSYWYRQRWLQPLLDFSIPPHQVYTTVSAWQLLDQPDQVLADLGLTSLENQIVIVAPGGYDEAGSAGEGEDNWPLPPALAYWRNQTWSGVRLTGGEAHAYMAQHFLTGRLVVPIPDLWMVLLAAALGKAIAIGLSRYRGRSRPVILVLAIATAGYGLVSLQLYISGAVLFPWLLPSLTVWTLVLPQLRRKTHGS